jgi:hypothetical protein
MTKERDMIENPSQENQNTSIGSEIFSAATAGAGKPKRKWGRITTWTVVIIVVLFLVIQYVNAAKYEALVQVIKEDKIGVNPTAERLDFGDLPRDKSAVRSVTLASTGSMNSYIMVWKYGDISDLIKVSKNFFTLEKGKTEKLEFTINIPNSAQDRYYRGKVVIFQIPKPW